jgi:16S rRNA (guanine1516-N2)-methyltransferase
MPTVPLYPTDPTLRQRAEQFAARFGFSLAAERPQQGYWLELTEQRLTLCTAEGHGEVYADFVDGAARHRREQGGGRGQPVAKAVGLKGSGSTPTIVDATAGLGRDAFVLASLGCAVTLVERSPIAAALLADALERAAVAPETADIAARMQLVHADGRQWLLALEGEQRPDVVYVDPMFPDTGKSAAAKKEMQAFQAVIGDDLDSEDLLQAARSAAKKRVVVKRPRLGAPIAGAARSGEIVGKSTRFDLYAPSRPATKE